MSCGRCSRSERLSKLGRETSPAHPGNTRPHTVRRGPGHPLCWTRRNPRPPATSSPILPSPRPSRGSQPHKEMLFYVLFVALITSAGISALAEPRPAHPLITHPLSSMFSMHIHPWRSPVKQRNTLARVLGGPPGRRSASPRPAEGKAEVRGSGCSRSRHRVRPGQH